MSLLKNKKADERYLSPWMFAIWALVGIFIVAGVLMFYNAQGDVRELEADILNIRIFDCISKDFSYSEVSAEEFDIYDKCGLNQAVLDESGNFYFKIIIKDESGQVLGNPIKAGANFETECGFQLEENRKEQGFPQCVFKELSVFDKTQNKEYILDLTTASNQIGK